MTSEMRLSRGAGRVIPGWCGWAALAVLWVPLFWHWRLVWSSSSEYYFGWAVPLLVTYLLCERWRDRPPMGSISGWGKVTMWGLLWLGLAMVLVSLPVLEANPFWPLVQWWAAAGACLVSLAGLGLVGGGGWVRHFGFPILFLTTALSWPSFLTTAVVTDLGGANAWLSAECSSALGRPALAVGNIIEVSSGLVGVDEACSGLRSLQAVWMVGWFFGELFRLSALLRLGLVGFSIGVAFLGNILRTIFLTWQAAGGGAAAVDAWHDEAGNIILLVTLTLVAGLGAWLSRGKEDSVATSGKVAGRSFPLSIALAVMGTMLFGVFGTEAWYRFKESKNSRDITLWSLEPPEGGSPITLPERSVEILGSTSYEGYTWKEAGDQGGLAYVARWEGSVVKASGAELHDPLLCLPSVGAVLEAQLEPVKIVHAGQTLEFQCYQFDTAHGVEFIFFGLWDANLAAMRPARESLWDNLTSFRTRLVLGGQRRADLAHVTFVSVGINDASIARAWFENQLPHLLKPVRGKR